MYVYSGGAKMKALVFQIEFKSDIVLPASSNTEGKIDQLDFIAGSNFLGMVAQKYKDFQNNFDIFHSGKVRFGDAHILGGDQPTYKIPYSYVHPKLNNETLYNHHQLEKEDFDTLGQLKQLREGYMTVDQKPISIETVYSQKSAYDKTRRTSKEGQMYGYTALKKGSVWQFVVKVDETISNEDAKLIKKTLQESKRLGKSKSAEYGEVEITLCEFCPPKYDARHPELDSGSTNNEVVLYCNSRLALVDEFGNPTYDLNCLCEGIEIVYEKTQIRTSTFTPYNGARQTKDYERVCINKGSVIVVKSLTDAQKEQIQNGIGAFLSEGFGEIIINPSFLMKKEFPLQKEPKDEKSKDKRKKLDIDTKDNTVLFLQNRHNQNIDRLSIANEVAEFIENKKSTFSNIKSSQWGNIRSIVSSNQSDYIEKITEYITTGTKKWEVQESTPFLNAINTHTIDQQKFTKLLAMKMGGKNDTK